MGADGIGGVDRFADREEFPPDVEGCRDGAPRSNSKDSPIPIRRAEFSGMYGSASPWTKREPRNSTVGAAKSPAPTHESWMEEDFGAAIIRGRNRSRSPPRRSHTWPWDLRRDRRGRRLGRGTPVSFSADQSS